MTHTNTIIAIAAVCVVLLAAAVNIHRRRPTPATRPPDQAYVDREFANIASRFTAQEAGRVEWATTEETLAAVQRLGGLAGLIYTVQPAGQPDRITITSPVGALRLRLHDSSDLGRVLDLGITEEFSATNLVSYAMTLNGGSAKIVLVTQDRQIVIHGEVLPPGVSAGLGDRTRRR